MHFLFSLNLNIFKSIHDTIQCFVLGVQIPKSLNILYVHWCRKIFLQKANWWKKFCYSPSLDNISRILNLLISSRVLQFNRQCWGETKKGQCTNYLTSLRKKSCFNYVSIILTNTSTLYDFSTLPTDFFLRFNTFLIEVLRGGKGAKEGEKLGNCWPTVLLFWVKYNLFQNHPDRKMVHSICLIMHVLFLCMYSTYKSTDVSTQM